MAVNVRGVDLGIHTVLPRMLARGGGVIANVASAVVDRTVRNRTCFVIDGGFSV